MRLLSEQAIDDLKAAMTICENLHEKIIYRWQKQYGNKNNWEANRSSLRGSDRADFTEKSHRGYFKKNQKIAAKLIEKLSTEISLVFKAASRFFSKKN